MEKKIKKLQVHFLSQIEPSTIQKLLLTKVGEEIEKEIFNYFKDLEKIYPDFKNWYKKVMKEFSLKTGKREIVLGIMDSEDKAELVGVSILKKVEKESKICAIRIHEDYKGDGIGTALFEKSFEYLGTKTPMITISEDVLSEFKYHIEKYSFKEKQQKPDYYIPGKVEYVFNGEL